MHKNNLIAIKLDVLMNRVKNVYRANGFYFQQEVENLNTLSSTKSV